MSRIAFAAVFLGLSMSPLLALADTQTSDSLWVAKQYQPVVIFTAGPDFIRTGRAQSLTLLPPFQNYYTVRHSAETAADVGAFVGAESQVSNFLRLQLGVAAYVDDTFAVQGDVWQFGSPLFDNLGYSYNVKNKRLMFGGKLFANVPGYNNFYPYFSTEIGVAFNTAYGYQETSLTNGVPPTAPFASRTQSSFTYAVGLGMDYAVTQRVRLGIGYQFLNLGSASLGRTSAATTTQTLSLSHLYTNQLRFQLTLLV